MRKRIAEDHPEDSRKGCDSPAEEPGLPAAEARELWEAIVALSQRLHGAAGRVVRRARGGGLDRDELVEDALVAAWRRSRDLAVLDLSPAQLWRWLVTAVEQAAANRSRTRRRERARERERETRGKGDCADASDPVARLLWREQRTFLARAFKRLDRNERRVLFLADFHGLSLKTVAQRLGLPGHQSASRLRRRAIDKLRQALDQDGRGRRCE